MSHVDPNAAPELATVTYVPELEARAVTDISPKVSGGIAAGAVATLAVFIAHQFGLVIPAGVEGALAVLVGYAASYWIPDNR
jgi:hypothetical protein